MRNYFIYNGKSSLDFGVYIGGQSTFDAPERDISKVSIPGRNGDLIWDNNRWKNIIIPYHVVMMEDFKRKASDFNSWLSNIRGYKKLIDTYHPEYFRLATFHGPISYSTAAFNNAGSAIVQFDCKPQKFSVNGDIEKHLVSGEYVFNPSEYASDPLIKITCSGNGTLMINSQSILIDDYTGVIYVDSDLQDCYDDSGINQNSHVSLTEFPKLNPGENAFSWTGDISNVTVTGRWFWI